MLPQVSLYKQIQTEAGEPLDAYQGLFDRVAKTFDAREQAASGYEVLMSNLKAPNEDMPVLDKIKSGITKSLSDIAKEAASTGRYDIASTKTKDLGMKLLTDPTIKHLQEQYAAMKPDLDLLNSPKKGLYVGGEGINKFKAINEDGTFNTYTSPLEERMDYNRAADEATKNIKPIVENIVAKLTPEQQAAFGGNADNVLRFIEQESLTNKELANHMSEVMSYADADPALQQYARFNGGKAGVAKLIADRFSTGTYKNENVKFQNMGAFAPETVKDGTKGDTTDTAFQFSEFGTIKNNINSEAFKTFDESSDAYNNRKTLSKEQINELAQQGVYNMPTAFDKPGASSKDKEFLTNIKNLNPKLKDLPLNEIAKEVNKNKEAYVAMFKQHFGQQNILIDVANKVETGSGFDKVAKSLALNSKNVLVEGADPKDKGKTLKDQLDGLGLDISDLEGANKEVIGINIDTTSSDDSYNGGLVTQITTKDGSKSFRVVSYNETYKNTFKGYAGVKKDLMKLGNTENQRKQLEKGEELKSNWYNVAEGVKAHAVKKLSNGNLQTMIVIKQGEDETEMPVSMFDEHMTNLLANNKYFKTNFK